MVPSISILVAVFLVALLAMIGDCVYEMDQRRARFVDACASTGGVVSESRGLSYVNYDCTHARATP